jgi:chaperonin GroES
MKVDEQQQASIPIPLNDTVLIIEDPRETQTASGIFLPDGYRTKVGDQEMNHAATRLNPRTGRVVAVGPGLQYPDGTHNRLSLLPGERILFERMTGVEIKYEQGSYLVVDEKAVLCVIREDN